MARIVAVSAVACGSVCERVAREKSSKRSRRTTVRATRRAAAQPARDAVDQRDQGDLDGLERSPPSGRARAASRSSRDAGPAAPAEDRELCASAWRWLPDARPSIATSAGAAKPGDLADGRDPAARELARPSSGPTPQRRLDGERVEEVELAFRWDDEQAVRLGDGARDLREELRPRDADRDRQADSLEDVAAQAHRDLARRARDPLEPADVEKRLVDRDPLDERASCPRRPRRPPCSPPSRPSSAAARRSRAGRARGRASRSSRCARRRPSPRSSRPARPRRRRSRAGRAGEDRRAARPTRRTHPGRRAGSSRRLTRTHVRIGSACFQSTRLHAAPDLTPLIVNGYLPDANR